MRQFTTAKNVPLTLGDIRKTALVRAREMMQCPMGRLPQPAVEFAKYTCAKVGVCSEVLLTCWAIYAQIVEGLPCDDELYKAQAEDKEWFAARAPLAKEENHEIR